MVAGHAGNGVMRILFRTDASRQIGTGHVMRCLTLANALRELGASCLFVCRAHEGHLAEHISKAGHEVSLLPVRDIPQNPMFDAGQEVGGATDYASWLGCDWEEDATETADLLENGCDWLVVDHYALDARWEQKLRLHARHIMVIDDLANRSHDCDLLLDQNLGRVVEDYKKLVDSKTRCLIGPQYALLRPEFEQWREYSLKRRLHPELKQILVSLGGVDKGNVTSKVLDALAQAALPMDCNILVVMGPHAPWLEAINNKAEAFPGHCEVKTNVVNMAELMAKSDLAIGAAGSTSWERCCLGLPTLLFVLADNQLNVANALIRAGAAVLHENPHDMSRFSTILSNDLSNQKYLAQLSRCAELVADGKGLGRIAEALREMACEQG